MKQQILHFTLCLCLLVLGDQVQAQVTITDDFPRPGDFTDIRIAGDGTGITAPPEGQNQEWDYSWLTNEGTGFTTYTAVSGNPDFPEAYSSSNNNFGLQIFTTPSKVYYGFDADGWHTIGADSEQASFSLGLLTGLDQDSLHLLAGPRHYEGRLDFLQFPVTYGKTWTQTQIRTGHFEIDVALFGLEDTPGHQKLTFSHTREVVGEGTVRIPKTDGTPSEPIEVLLLKVNIAVVDSYFLAGEPAPEALLAGFFLTQGAISEAEDYYFYNPNYGAPVLWIRPESEVVQYSPTAADMVTSIEAIEPITTRYYPNPISAGQTLNIQTDHTLLKSGYVNITDLAGRSVYKTAYEPGYEIQVPLPDTMLPSIYFYQIQDRQEKVMGQGKLMIQ